MIAALNDKEAADLRLYSDPECKELKKALAGYYGVEPENIYVGNGSDEALNFACLLYTSNHTNDRTDHQPGAFGGYYQPLWLL